MGRRVDRRDDMAMRVELGAPGQRHAARGPDGLEPWVCTPAGPCGCRVFQGVPRPVSTAAGHWLWPSARATRAAPVASRRGLQRAVMQQAACTCARRPRQRGAQLPLQPSGQGGAVLAGAAAGQHQLGRAGPHRAAGLGQQHLPAGGTVHRRCQPLRWRKGDMQAAPHQAPRPGPAPGRARSSAVRVSGLPCWRGRREEGGWTGAVEHGVGRWRAFSGRAGPAPGVPSQRGAAGAAALPSVAGPAIGGQLRRAAREPRFHRHGPRIAACLGQPLRQGVGGRALSVTVARSPTTFSWAVAPRRCVSAVRSAPTASPGRGAAWLGLQLQGFGLQALHVLQLGIQLAHAGGGLRSVASAGARATHHSSARATMALAASTRFCSRGARAFQRACKGGGAAHGVVLAAQRAGCHRPCGRGSPRLAAG
jgi:hypothetical protein